MAALASRSARFLAHMVNLAAVFGISLLVLGVLVLIEPAVDLERLVTDEVATALIGVPWCAINLYLIVTRSQSVGKMVLRIKVVNEDGTRCPWAKQLVLRWFLPWVAWLYWPLTGWIDALLIFSRDNRTVHDRLAGTIVVVADEPVRPYRRVGTVVRGPRLTHDERSR